VSAEDWEREAEHWIAWARTPGHDSYVLYRDAFFALVPDPGRATLELGRGEGRVTRDLEEAGFAIEALREPAMPDVGVQRDPSERRWQRLPCFLMLRAVCQ